MHQIVMMFWVFSSVCWSFDLLKRSVSVADKGKEFFLLCIEGGGETVAAQVKKGSISLESRKRQFVSYYR